MAKNQDEETPQPIIIKKVKKGGHGGHHGGAWKVAYADFVTAMMAFFLLLWLLQATTEEQKLGIADYFAPSSVSRNKSGSGGMMGGRTFTKKGSNPNDQTPVGVGVMIQLPSSPSEQDEADDPKGTAATEETGAGGEDDETLEEAEASEQAEAERLEEMLAQHEEQQFAEAEEALREAIEAVPDLKGMIDNLVIDQTPEGMRIQIVDEEGKSMFPSGSAEMFDHTRKLIALVVDAVKQLPQQVAIKGHTDAAPFINEQGYSNWELSTDRANSSRRALVAAGLPPQRISSVVGLADTEHLDTEDPLSPRNRRISIILLRENSLAAKGAKATKGTRKQSAAAPKN